MCEQHEQCELRSFFFFFLLMNSQSRKGKGVAVWQEIRGNLWVGGDKGWSGPVSSGQCRFRIGHVGGRFNTGKMVPVCRLHQRGTKKGTMVIVLLF